MSGKAYKYRQERKQAEKARQNKQWGDRISKIFKILKITGKPSFLKKVLSICLILVLISAGGGVMIFASMLRSTPDLDSSKLVDPLSTKFYDRNGNFIYEYGKEKRTKITYEQLPKVLEQAFIATEDSHFFEHNGIDLKRTAKAIFVNVTGDFGSQGGSTITQQVIKNSILTPEKTVERKVQEWDLAFQLEQKYSKQEILMMYLNKIYLGNRSYGVAAAAKNYYGLEVKDLNKLTLAQAAMLAGLPQSPNHYDPTIPENRDSAAKRRDLVLNSMVREGYISEAQKVEAEKVPVTEGLVPKKSLQNMPYEAFFDATVKEVLEQLKDVDIGTAGLSIYTTLDPKAQDYADKLLNTNEIISYPNPRFQGAFVFLDTKTGDVRAIGSGRNEYKAQFLGNNFAIEMKRQPGSTFKPIFDYGPAIEKLKWSTGHMVEDTPTTYSNGQPISNWDHNYHGVLTIRKALKYSYNIPALLTLKEVGMDEAQTFAENLGISFHNNQVYESFAIGSNAVNPLEMAGAYSAFGNDGVYNPPHFVQKVIFPNGKEVSFQPKAKRVMQDYTAYMVTDMLRTVVDAGSGKTANVPGLDIAGKTGSTNFDKITATKYGYPSGATNDSWFAGYTPQYTMAVWTGYNQNAPGNFMTGNSTLIAQKLFKAMMQSFGTDPANFKQPSSVYRVNGELYIKGVNSAEVPPKLKNEKTKGRSVDFTDKKGSVHGKPKEKKQPKEKRKKKDQ